MEDVVEDVGEIWGDLGGLPGVLVQSSYDLVVDGVLNKL